MYRFYWVQWGNSCLISLLFPNKSKAVVNVLINTFLTVKHTPECHQKDQTDVAFVLFPPSYKGGAQGLGTPIAWHPPSWEWCTAKWNSSTSPPVSAFSRWIFQRVRFQLLLSMRYLKRIWMRSSVYNIHKSLGKCTIFCNRCLVIYLRFSTKLFIIRAFWCGSQRWALSCGCVVHPSTSVTLTQLQVKRRLHDVAWTLPLQLASVRWRYGCFRSTTGSVYLLLNRAILFVCTVRHLF